MDRFSLIDVQNLSSETPEILKIKNFLEKFYIRFDNISHPFKIHDSRDISDLINYICDECDGISFTAFTLMTYSEYTHSNYHFSSDSLFALEKQVIYHCLIVSLYTILDFRSRHDYKRLTEILTKYRSKTYASLSDTGYDAKDNSSANRFRTAFDKLDELNTLENFGESQSDYFYKTINIRTEKDSINNTVRCINSFLDEFTYDMIRNTFNQGFNITQKLSLLQKLNLSQKLSPSPSKQNTNNYHREIRRFLDKLHQLDNNFIPTSKLNVLNYLYYYKKASCNHFIRHCRTVWLRKYPLLYMIFPKAFFYLNQIRNDFLISFSLSCTNHLICLINQRIPFYRPCKQIFFIICSFS